MKTITLNSFDSHKLHCYLWDNVENPRGILQISHGMAEHAKRYDKLATYLNKNGYFVFANDQRAHGLSATSINKVGKIVGGDLFKQTVEDQLFITNYLKETYQLPLVILGHSYGSFITQNYIQKTNASIGAIIMGSAYQKNALTSFGNFVANLTCLFKGVDAPANMIANLSFGAYEKQFEDRMWITSNKEEFEKYQQDPFCGATFSAGFYKYFFKNLLKSYSKQGLANIPKDYPIFIVSGEKDPVGESGKSVQKLFDCYKNNGLNVNMKLYENMRHEILNETNNDIVYSDILDYLNTTIK